MPLRRRSLVPLLLSALAAGLTAAAIPAATVRPNVVFILTDDQDLVLNSMSYMPQTRALLAQQGMTFTQDFVPLSLCCPSRSTILTGLYPHNHKVYTNVAPDGGFAKFAALGHEEATVATALHAVGYRTALFGKYLNGYPDGAQLNHVPPGWNAWASPAIGDAYNNFDYTLNEDGALVPYGSSPQDYLTDVIAGKATRFIRSSASGGQPFFLYLAAYTPHKPSVPAPRHAGLFPGVQAPRTPSFNEADVSDKPAKIQHLPLLSSQSTAAIDQLYRQRLQTLQAVDEAVAAIVHTLEAAGQLGNTYVFFTSDNGYHMGQHRLQPGKYTPYEPDVRVPLLVRGPGIAAGSSSAALTVSVDFAPTIAELAGARLPVEPDGRSLVPLFNGPTPADWRQVVLLEQFAFSPPDHPPHDTLEPPDPQDAGVVEYPSHLGLRTPNFKYVERQSGDLEVYDLRADPDELKNLARRRLNATWLGKMKSLVRRLGACAGESCRQLEAQPVPALPAVR